MTDAWGHGPTSAILGLRARGFSPAEARRLVALQQRYLQGAFTDLTDAQQRLRFVRWLVEHGRLSDTGPRPAEHDDGDLAG